MVWCVVSDKTSAQVTVVDASQGAVDRCSILFQESSVFFMVFGMQAG